MELADECVDESPFRMHVGSSFSAISAPAITTTTNNNGNPFSLFYSPSSAIQHNNVIQSSRASNSWIASLRSNKQRSYSPVISALDGRQHHYELKRDGAGNNRNNKSHGTGANHVRSTSIDGGLSSSSHSLPSSSFRRFGSLESIQRNQRLKQLAAQSTTKVRSLSARESTAAAERWRYIQTVLERRRKESLEHRERFIRQPLDNILRQKGTAIIKPQIESPAWDSLVTGRSILKRRTQNWRMKARRHVHFDINQIQNETTEHYQEETCNREKLPIIIPIPEEKETPSNESSFAIEEDQRLPPLLMTPSPTMEITTDPQSPNNIPQQRLSPSGPSWVERQVAKVRQRKLWAFRQQQQQQQQQQQEKLNHHHPPRAILKRSASLLVNVPDAVDTETDSLNEEEEDDEGDRSEEEDVTSRNARQSKSLAWEVVLDKDELAEMSNEQIKEETTVDSYGGWPHFPVKLAICIQQRQKSLKEREAGRNDGKLNHHHNNNNNNSFERRKRFGKRLSIAVVTQRKKRIPKRLVASSIHQQSSHPQHENEDEIDPVAVFANPIADDDDVGQCLTNAISSLQVLDPSNLVPISAIHADVVSETSSSTSGKSNEIQTMASTPSPRSPSDLIIQAEDVTQPAEDSSVSPAESSDAETIVADVHYHLDALIPAHQGTIDDEDYYPQTAGSTFCPVSVCQRPDESISDVIVNDGPYHIDQPESTNVTTIPQQQDDGMACRADASIPAAPGISSVEQTGEYHILTTPPPPIHSAAIDNKDRAIRGRRLPAYCSGWPIVISNQNGDAIPQPPVATVSYWNNFEAPTSEETMTGTINHPEVDISSEATAFIRLIPPKDSNHPPTPRPPVSPVIIQTLLDKKAKEARNASRILFPTVMSIRTQTDSQTVQGSKDDFKAEEEKMTSDSMPEDAKELEETVDADCQCLHRAVLTCLLPEAAETLDNLELIRRQLKKARIRRQGSDRQRQPLQVRRDILADPANDSTTNEMEK